MNILDIYEHNEQSEPQREKSREKKHEKKESKKGERSGQVLSKEGHGVSDQFRILLQFENKSDSDDKDPFEINQGVSCTASHGHP